MSSGVKQSIMYNLILYHVVSVTLSVVMGVIAYNLANAILDVCFIHCER